MGRGSSDLLPRESRHFFRLHKWGWPLAFYFEIKVAFFFDGGGVGVFIPEVLHVYF